MVANPRSTNATGPAFEETWTRIKRLTGMNTQRELAQMLDIQGPSVTDAKQKGVFPLTWAYKIALKKGISLDLIVMGREPSGEVEAPQGECRKPLYIDSAVELVDEAVKASGCLVNSEQKAALVSIIREELKKKAENLVRALTV